MSIEITLLKVLGDSRHLYFRVSPYIKEHTYSKETSRIIKLIQAFYEENESEEQVDWDALSSVFLATAKLSDDEVELYKAVFERIMEMELSSIPDAVNDILNHYIKMDYATRIADTAMRIAEGDNRVDMNDVLKNVTEYTKEIGSAFDYDSVFTPVEISSIVDKVAGGGYEWRLEPLNISLGPIRKGDFIVIAARPETGKTTMIASELTHIGSQMPIAEGPIIWVNNEENSDKVMFRTVQAALGCHKDNILADMDTAMESYVKLMNGNKQRILITEKSSKHNNVNYLNGLFAEMRPSIIVFDQLDKVHGFNHEKQEHLRLGKLYEWARELTEKCAVIAVSQVNGSGEGERWIFQNQLRGSTTDKAGEADAIITIGRANDPSLAYSRFIHVPKNKLFGGSRSEEEHRHGYWECEIKPDIARYIWSGKRGDA